MSTADVSSSPSSFMNNIVTYFKEFRVLRQTPREYWGIQAINFLDSMAYFSLLTVITLFLSEEIRLSDTNAGYVVTVFTSLTTILLLFSGFLTDSLGIRKSMVLAYVSRALCTLTIVGLALGGDGSWRTPLIIAALVLMAPSMAMIQTIFQSANKRYTNQKSRSAGFNLWYLFMNIGAACSGVFIDIIRLTYGLSTTWIVAFGLIQSLLCLILLVFFVRQEEQFGDDGKFVAVQNSHTQVEKQKPLKILKDMVSETAFWRFLSLVTLLLGVRAVFAYMYLLMPKYWIRVMGEQAAIGTLNTINPVLIIVGLILFIPITNKYPIFKMLVYGAIISSLSLFALVMPWQTVAKGLTYLQAFLPSSWLADPVVSAYYGMAVLSMITLSIGEVIWSPKLQEYTAAIAPEGQEGSYFGLSMIPWFLAKTVASLMSGHMLTRWVPEGVGARIRSGELSFWDSPEAMWLTLGLIAISGPVIALLFQSWFTAGARWNRQQAAS